MQDMCHESYRIGSYNVFYISNFLSEDEEQYTLRKIHESPKQKWKQLANRRHGVGQRRLEFRDTDTTREGGEITTKGLLPQSLPSFLTAYPDIIHRLKKTGVFANSPHQEPNHVILNEYRPGQGIMPHEDGPKYFPVVATISLGAHAVFNYYRYKPSQPGLGSDTGKVIDQVPELSVLLEPRSLIISSGDMYTSYLHGIEPVEEDHILPPFASTVSQSSETARPADCNHRVTIGNRNLLGDENLKKIVDAGGALKRGTRYSLTCRDVGRVSSAKSFRFT